MTTYPDHILRMGSQHLAELKRKAAEFERQLWDAHESLEYEVTQSSFAPQGGIDAQQEAFRWRPDVSEPAGASGRRRPARCRSGFPPARIPLTPSPPTRRRTAPQNWSATGG